jgi:hypothetical protein
LASKPVSERIQVIREVMPLSVFREQTEGIGWTENELCGDHCFFQGLMSRFAKHESIEQNELPFKRQQLNADFGPKSDNTVKDYIDWLLGGKSNGQSRGSQFFQVRSAERGVCSVDPQMARDKLYQNLRGCFLKLQRERFASVFSEDELLSAFNEAFTKFDNSYLSSNEEWVLAYPNKEPSIDRDRYVGLKDICRLLVFFFGLGCLPRILLGLDSESFRNINRHRSNHGLNDQQLDALEGLVDRYMEKHRFDEAINKGIAPTPVQMQMIYHFVKFRKRGGGENVGEDQTQHPPFVQVQPPDDSACLREVISKLTAARVHTKECKNSGQASNITNDELLVLLGHFYGDVSIKDLAQAKRWTEQKVYQFKYAAIEKLQCCVKAECGN